MKIVRTVSFMLSKLAVAHRNLTTRAMNEIGLHSGQVFLLLELWQNDGRRQTDLAEAMQLTAPTVNKILGGLLDAGLVVRERLDGDARSTRIYLTEDGRAIRDAVEEQWIELETQALAGLTETEALLFRQLLEKLLGYSDEE